MTFKQLRLKMRPNTPVPKVMLCLDPGHTTGLAVFTDGELTAWEQAVTIEDIGKGLTVDWKELIRLFDKYQPTQVVCEDYRIYQHKLDQHTFSQVATLRLIGGIDMLCYQRGIPIDYQLAIEHKGFCSDKKLEAWGYWQRGMRHSRDAIRVGCYWLLFHK